MMMKLFLPVLLLAIATQSQAAVREGGGNTKLINKLQTTLNEITLERDQLKTNHEKVTTELTQLKKEFEKLKAEKMAVQKSENTLNSQLSSQKQSNNLIRQRLDQTSSTLKEAIAKIEEGNAKFYDVVDKYNALNQSCVDLDAEHKELQNVLKTTSAGLQTCEHNNIKLYEGSQKIIEGYGVCKKRGVIDTLLDSEPVFQIKSVETEKLMQEYEDKIRKQKYQNPNQTSENLQAPQTQSGRP